MASLLFRETKGVSFSCASPASAAVCSSLDQRSMIRPSTIRAGDRHAVHTREARRAKALSPLSQPHSKPKSNSNKSSWRSSEKPVSLISPANSSRYLLEDNAAFDVFPDGKSAVPALLPTKSSRFHIDADASAELRPSSTKATGDVFPSLRPTEQLRFQTSKADKSSALRPSSSTRQQDQVVVLRVSLHCKGCEGKVRKHISKMEGVTSYSIDMASKKVTVVGDVTPLSVLNSISKVKNAQIWPSPPRASASF